MKRVLLLVFLCLAMVFSLCACGDDKSSDRDSENKTKTVTVACASAYVMNVSSYDDNSYTGISESGLKASRLLVQEYIALLKSERMLGMAIDLYSERDVKHIPTTDELRSALVMTAVDETALLSIEVSAFHKKATEDELVWMCEDLLEVASDVVPSVMKGLSSICVVDEPAICYKAHKSDK